MFAAADPTTELDLPEVKAAGKMKYIGTIIPSGRDHILWGTAQVSVGSCST